MNMEDIMKQAQQFQQRMGQVQEELAAQTITSSVGGGMVTATVNGKHELLSLTIEKEVINPDDPAMLQDLVVAAVNDAMSKAGEMAQSEMGKLTGGLNIPGLSGLS
ncbi:MAG: YbaB/EbfC family nucleoid-associated protein [Thermodesulfobacteriota bacterium]|nr:YbaB/EbfC family nucleoid-associated protein [Thermodesulfobacteriota bacterium]